MNITLRVVSFLLLCVVSTSGNAFWLSGKKTDEFTGVVQATASNVGYPKLGLRCDHDGRRVIRMITFEFEYPFAYYNKKVTIMVRVGDEIMEFQGQMYSDVMNGGYGLIRTDQFEKVTEILSRGNHASLRVLPDGVGEQRGGRVTLDGSARSIARMKEHCYQ